MFVEPIRHAYEPTLWAEERYMWAHTEDLSDDFFTDLIAMCGRLKCKPDDMLAVMNRESGVKSWAHNTDGTPFNESDDAWGLNQIMSFHLKAGQYGWNKSVAVHEFTRLTAKEQLPYVEKYFEPYISCGLVSVGALYAMNFLPGRAIDRGCKPATILTSRGESYYEHNRGLDFDKDGHITMSDLTSEALSFARGNRWDEILKRLRMAEHPVTATDPDIVADNIDLTCAEGQQCALKTLGYECEIDGIWGPQSAAACRSMQYDKMLDVDGICGPITQAALREALKG